MKKRNKILALMLAAILAMSMTACGGKDSGNENAANGAADAQKQETVDPFEEAQKNIAAVTNMDASMVMEMDMEVGANGETQTMESVTTMDMSTFSDPVRLKMDMNVKASVAGQETTQQMSVYADTLEDGTNMMYLFDGTNWQSQAVTVEDIAQYDSSTDMAVYLNGNYNFEQTGTEQVDGANAYKYTGKITGEEMKEVILSSGALDQLSSLGMSSEDLDSMLDGVGELPINLWIDEATLYPVKYEMDMTDVMNTLMTNMVASMGEQAEGLSMSIPKMVISMTCKNFNAATEFEIPEEAKAN